MEHYDVIIIGTGAGGGTLAHRLAPSGKRILLLERGGYLPREPENWDSNEVFGRERYVTTERWYDKHGTAFRPHAQYFVGGNTKVYGAILFRLRERDFGEVQHYGGVSPAWPIDYSVLEPYYAQAEQLYLVHGQAGEDPERPFLVPQTLNVKHGLFIMENLATEVLAEARVYEFMFVLTHHKTRGSTAAVIAPAAVC